MDDKKSCGYPPCPLGNNPGAHAKSIIPAFDLALFCNFARGILYAAAMYVAATEVGNLSCSR